jgi:hypothetical protein
MRYKKDKPLKLNKGGNYLCSLCNSKFLGVEYELHKQKCAPQLQHRKYSMAIKIAPKQKVFQQSTKKRSEVLRELRASSMNQPFVTEDLREFNKKHSKKYALFVKK